MAASSSAPASIRVHGLAETQKAFRDAVGKEGPKRLRLAYKEVADLVASRAQSAARSGTPLEEKMAPALKAWASAGRGGGVAVVNTGSLQAAFVAFFGIDRRIGWFAGPKYSGTARDQRLPAWVGSNWKSNWQSGQFTEGPHAIREAARASVHDIEAKFTEAMARAYRDVGLQATP